MLCQFAHDFPGRVGTFLDYANQLDRSFREETVTDILMGALVALAPLGIQVKFTVESRSGADMEWLFKRNDGSSFFRLVIQAKRLARGGSQWTRRSYPEIFRKVESTGVLQAETLVTQARKRKSTFPLYMFYTNESVCQQARQSTTLDGVALASGQSVYDLIDRKSRGLIPATKASSLKVLQPLMFPLATILCSGVPRFPRFGREETDDLFPLLTYLSSSVNLSSILIPTPEAIRANLAAILGGGDSSRSAEELPQVGDGDPDEDSEDEKTTSRYRVVFRAPGRREEAVAREILGAYR